MAQGQIFTDLPRGCDVCALSVALRRLLHRWIVYSRYSRRSWDLHWRVHQSYAGWVKNTPDKPGTQPGKGHHDLCGCKNSSGASNLVG